MAAPSETRGAVSGMEFGPISETAVFDSSDSAVQSTPCPEPVTNGHARPPSVSEYPGSLNILDDVRRRELWPESFKLTVQDFPSEPEQPDDSSIDAPVKHRRAFNTMHVTARRRQDAYRSRVLKR